MEQLLQQFEKPITDAAGTTYRIYAYGRSRPADTWQGWLVFERLSDGRRFATDVETTQPNAEAVRYWASGLAETYFDGALARATAPTRPTSAPVAVPPSLIGEEVDADIRRRRLATIERDVLAVFNRRGSARLLTQIVFDELPYAHADVVRALEDLQKQGGLLVRRTEEGNDWIALTEPGLEAAGR